jgi:NIPSNAP
MVKWKILAFLGLMFGVAGVVWGYAQQKKAIGFFELRVYTAQPGKRDALAARFADRTAAIYSRHGITNVGYWIPQQSDRSWASARRTLLSTCGVIALRKNATSASRRPTTIQNLVKL